MKLIVLSARSRAGALVAARRKMSSCISAPGNADILSESKRFQYGRDKMMGTASCY